MTAPGALAQLLEAMMHDPAERQRRVMSDHVRANYAWSTLRRSYAALYRDIAA
ncbi:hypothetical protein GWI34_39405 [Actinomadura sp. DSM 109109]|nr:hypothetical protein [Actinomadura lepetitiana]